MKYFKNGIIMRNKKILCMFIFVFMIVLSIGAVSAQDADGAIASTNDDVVLGDSESDFSGTVSGGVDVVTENPWDTSGELSYDIPNDAKTIKSADVYVNIYSGSAANTYGLNTNVTVTTNNGATKYNEALWIEDGTTDGTVYTVNNHTTKCYSDYMVHYDVTNLLSGLNGTKLTVKVDNFEMANKSFDGRIKLIALVLAYNDDSADETISYWINANQLWTKSNVTLAFNTKGKSGVSTLTNVVLSSADGTYRMNGEFLGDSDKHVTGSTYQYNKWDVSNVVDKDKNTSLNVAYAGSSSYGSIKNVLSVLTINDVKADISMLPEYTASKNTVLDAFAGTNNALTITVTPSKSGKYSIRLLADGIVVNETEKTLNATSNSVVLIDPTIRDVDNTTVNGAENKKVNYTVELLWDDGLVNSTSINIPILYNGYLGKDFAYPAGGMESLDTIVINGDIVVSVKDAYLSGAGKLNKTDVWTINLDENSTIVKSFVYIPYTWCNIKETQDMFNVTFNGEKITPIALYRDQSNLGGASGGYGYGVFVYDVTSLINKSGDNTLFLSKEATYPGVYSSAFVYMYNTTNSNHIKEIYINHGADLLYNSYNKVNREVKSVSTINVNSKLIENAILYVFASNAQKNYTNLVVNGETYTDVFHAASYCTTYKELDLTGKVKDKNSISVVSTKGTFLALHQIMVLTKNIDDVDVSLATEYKNTCYAGTNNTLTITLEALKKGKYTLKLLADGVEVNSTEVDLVDGINKILLTDPTVRAVNASTVYGADNTKVKYAAQLIANNATIASNEITVPVLYNGNLGKDLAYPAGGYESFVNVTITGDIVIDIKDVSSYMGSGVLNKANTWTINLDSKSNIVKSYVYVAYNWCDPSLATEGLDMINATFNGVNVKAVTFYRDQGNLGTYAKYGYGVLVYDVTDLINKAGDNTLVLNKSAKYPAIYPPALIYMYNTTGSAFIKNVYISNGADLLASSSTSFKNDANRPVQADSTIDVATIKDTSDVKLYVFAASAQKGEGNIVFNGQTSKDVWNGTSSTTDLFTLDITNSVKNTNNISFVSTGATILALQQIIVTTHKAPTTIVAPAVTKVYNVNKNLVISLKDTKGNIIKNADIVVKFNNVKKTYNTGTKGQVVIAIANLAPKTYTVSIAFGGDDNYLKSSASTKVIVKKATPKLTAKKKVTFKVKTKTKKYYVVLKTNKGKAIKNAKLTLKIKGKVYKAFTNAKGKATFKITKLNKKGKFSATLTYAGNKYYTKVVVKNIKITVKK